MTHDQEIKMTEAVQLLNESGAVFVVLYGFPGDFDCYVEGRGDKCKENQARFLAALYHHWEAKK